MEIRNIICTFFFNRIEVFINKINELENSRLSKYFITPFNAQPVPNDAPPILPRITASSSDGCYDLIISQVNVQVVRKVKCLIDDTTDRKLAEMKEIVLDVYNSLKGIYNKDFFYFGTNYIVDIDNENPVKSIIEKYTKGIENDICEINIRYSLVDEEKYYSNIILSNTKEYQLDIQVPKEQIGKQNNIIIDTLSISKMKEISHKIQLSVDINDKYSYNLDENYRTNETEVNHILEKTKKLTDMKIKEFTEE